MKPAPPEAPRRGFLQVEQPFDLPEEIQVGESTLSGTFARTYVLLAETRRRNLRHPVGREMGPAGWVPNTMLVEPWSGGGQGLRRVRQLRTEYGCDIETRRHQREDGARSNTFLYRLKEGAVPPPPQGRAGGATESLPAPSRSDAPLRGLTLRWSGNVPPQGPPSSLRRGASFWPMDPDASEDDYLQALRRAHKDGRMLEELQGVAQLVLTPSPERPERLLRVLARVLVTLGAEVAA